MYFIFKGMELINTHLVKKSDLGIHNNLFGGEILSWIDNAAAAYAMQVCDTPRMVTLSIDACRFEKPAKEGQLIKIYADIVEIGNTSLTLYIEVRSHNVYTGKQKLIVKTNIKFVKIDEEGTPLPISDKVKIKYKKKGINVRDFQLPEILELIK